MRKFFERHQLGSISWPGDFSGFREMLLATDKGSLALTKKSNLSPAEYKECARLKGPPSSKTHCGRLFLF